MRPLAVALVLLTLLPTAAQPPRAAGTYASLKQQAEAAYAEKSFGRAHETYEQASQVAPPDEKRWVAMRLADTGWRMDAANPVADDTQRQTAQRALEGLIRDSSDDHDRIWAEANESLGDYWWTHPRLRNISAAQPWYVAALDWWAGSADLPLARRRYLAIVFRMVEQPDGGWYGSYLPGEILQNAVAIAETAEDRAHTRYLLARQLINTGAAGVERALELLGEIIAQGKTTAWYDDALFMAASQFADRGKVVVRENGETAIQPDYLKALELYRRIVNEYKPGETRYYDQAIVAIGTIVSPSVSVMVAGTFLPRSEQEIVLAWRNVNAVEMRIAAVDLVRDADASKRGVQWIDLLPITAGVRSWMFQTNDRGDHVPGTDRIRLKPNLEPGAYVVQASAGGRQSRQLLLVTDANIAVHELGGRADLLVNDVLTGEPIAGSRIRVWLQPYSSNKPQGSIDLTTDSSGLATIQFAEGEAGTISVFASTPRGRQAYWFSSYYRNRAAYDEWRLYAFTDRPAYRPGETVRWKFIARARQRDQWRTPAGETIEYDIMSPRGEKAASGKAALNQFGSFWSELPLTPSMALGQYTIQFRRNQNDTLGSAPLFRLEEYKLPEFRVGVTTPDKKQFRLGETIEVAIDASYYFGGPVANATVEAVVHTRPFVRYWSDVRERYPWYFQHPDYGFGQELKRETLKTDANGKATLRIETSVDSPDTIFTIDARVTDASRREVSGSGSIRVTRQRYAVMAHPEHYLFRPGDKVGIDFKAADANDQPVQTTGTVRVVRRRWDEVWIDPAGREVSGPELDRLRSAAAFPSPRERGRWRQTFVGYREEDVLTTKLTTDAQGEATLRFDAPDAGYYAVRWTSEDRDPGRPARARDVVTAETTVWVTRSATMDIGYRAGGVEIIADRDAFRSGRTAPVMIVTPASGRWVMLTTSGDSILNTQVLHVEGTVKLVEIALDDRHVPSFYLTASSVFDRTLASTSKQIIVPPVEHFIDVGVTPDRAEYEPRQEGTVTITTRNIDGKAVSAEVAVSVFDESVTAIQSDPAGDPRAFFFGATRAAPVQVTASVRTQRYLMLTDEDGTLVDDRELMDRRRREAGLGKDEANQVEYKEKRGDVGGMVGGLAAPKAVSEAITVTAQSKVLDAAAGGKENIGTQIQVRSDFRSTAFWQPDVVTGPDGTATVKLKLPEALTTWRATARAVTTGSMVGMGSATTRTNMPLIVRLQAPRFFVAGDRATISAVLNNNTDAAMRVTPSLEVEGLALRSNATAAEVNVPARGEARADWIVAAERPGSAKLRVAGRTADRGDAMEKTFTVYPHGIDKLVARSGKLRAEEAIVKLDLPHDRRETTLTVQIQPSLAVTMLDALPYLIDYPYGCTEQTMSRFLPAAIVARTLAQNGLDVSDVEGRIFGGIERRFASQTHPKGAKDLHLLGNLTDASMSRLYDFQHGDGGWGWWKDGDSDDFMTAYVVWGFAVARDGGLRVNAAALDNAVRYLDRRLVEHENRWEMQAWMLHAIGAWRASHNIASEERRAFDNVWGHRERLTAYSRALLALAAHDLGDAERAAVMVRNLEDGVKIDRAPDKSILLRGSGSGAAEVMATAHWGEERTWWRWYDGPVESTAFALQALVRIDPKNKLIEPAMNWLVKNRRGAQWNNTRDTAIALLALTDYLRASGELKGDLGYELSANGHVVATKRVSAADVLAAPSRFVIDENLVRDANEIRIRRTSGRADAPIYFAVEGRFVSLEEPVTAAGNEIFVRRDYFRLAPQPTLLKGVTYNREPLRDQGMVNSGERVDVVVTIETKNDYDYLMLEDLKPAGLEAVALQSGSPLYATELKAPAVARKFAAGEPPAEKPAVARRSAAADRTGRNAWVYQELRDRNVALFIDHLPQGTWEIRYTLRAEVPGAFHALPLVGQAMYVPEIRGNSDEVRVTVNDTPR